jgi:hypothetical protein
MLNWFSSSSSFLKVFEAKHAAEAKLNFWVIFHQLCDLFRMFEDPLGDPWHVRKLSYILPAVTRDIRIDWNATVMLTSASWASPSMLLGFSSLRSDIGYSQAMVPIEWRGLLYGSMADGSRCRKPYPLRTWLFNHFGMHWSTVAAKKKWALLSAPKSFLAESLQIKI